MSSERRIARALGLLAACAGMCGGAHVAGAQAAVSGQIVLIERQGAERSELRSAVVYLESPDRIFHPAAARQELHQATIAMTGREFVPHIRVVLAGGAVSFPNQDPFSHNVFSNAEAGPFDLSLYRRGVSRTATFAHPGIYPVYCNIHSRMVSFVVAVPSTLVASVAADGRFMIPDVPPGTYLLTAWHERAIIPSTRQIVVPAGGLTAQRIVLDARAYVSGPHLNKFGQPYSATRVDRY